MSKNILITFLVFLIIMVSCTPEEEDDTIVIDFEGIWEDNQAELLEYLDTHYYNSNDGRIWTIGNLEDGSLPSGDQLPLHQDPLLDSVINIEENGLTDYKVYYYIEEEGKYGRTDELGEYHPYNVGFSHPSTKDSIFIRYSGILLDSTVFDDKEDYPRWFNLGNQKLGWRRGMPKFGRGTFVTVDNDFVFQNPGRGYLFVPSGLDFYGTGEVEGIDDSEKSCLIYRVEMDDVNLFDSDLDGVPDKFETTFDDSGAVSFYDTDNDGVFDWEDTDDDNDHNYQDTEYTYPSTTLDEAIDEYGYDEKGNIDFEYDSTGSVIVKSGSGKTDDPEGNIPNYKNDEEDLNDKVEN